MKQLEKFSENAMGWLYSQGLSAEDVQVVALGIAVLAVILALVALRRGRQAGSAQVSRIQDKVEKTVLQLGDARSKLELELKRLHDEQAQLKEKVVRLERELAAKRVASPETEQKKKLEDSATAPLLEPAPVAVAPAPIAIPAPVPIPAASTELPVTPVETAVPEEKRSSIFSGLKKTRDFFFARLSGILGTAEITEKTYEELEELLISGDLGVKTTQKLLGDLRAKVQTGEVRDAASCRELLKRDVHEILSSSVSPEIEPRRVGEAPLVILVVGVNGVGKTTTIGKLASRFSSQGARVLLGAADTFRAAAAEQIEVWAERANVEVLRGDDNAKPSTVAYEAIHRARKEHFDVVIIDTAGRLHTRVNLMNELGGVIDIIAREQPGAPHETLLVVDATTGQNALEQAREFHQRAKLTGVVVTKLDGTPKGGIVVAIKDELGVPIRYVGVGESAADLKPFSAEEFSGALFADGEASAFAASQGKGEVRAVRRRRTEETPVTSDEPVRVNGER